ncbi:hypothetical protein BGLA2_3150006 [Burkholderia gladioli]|nr:hypothetical protein BGLA2_3150006 [Burkholderia gladioli]
MISRGSFDKRITQVAPDCGQLVWSEIAGCGVTTEVKKRPEVNFTQRGSKPEPLTYEWVICTKYPRQWLSCFVTIFRGSQCFHAPVEL